jgi:hypothetical protein
VSNKDTVSTAVLFYVSKKRQWEVAARLRRSVKRVGTGLTKVMTPRTPHKMTFSPIEKSRNGSGGHALLSRSPDRQGRDGRGQVEKELPAVREERADGNGLEPESGTKTKRPTPPPVQVPQSKFEMDSPKTPLWSKVFGR